MSSQNNYDYDDEQTGGRGGGSKGGRVKIPTSQSGGSGKTGSGSSGQAAKPSQAVIKHISSPKGPGVRRSLDYIARLELEGQEGEHLNELQDELDLPEVPQAPPGMMREIRDAERAQNAELTAIRDERREIYKELGPERQKERGSEIVRQAGLAFTGAQAKDKTKLPPVVQGKLPRVKAQPVLTPEQNKYFQERTFKARIKYREDYARAIRTNYADKAVKTALESAQERRNVQAMAVNKISKSQKAKRDRALKRTEILFKKTLRDIETGDHFYTRSQKAKRTSGKNSQEKKQEAHVKLIRDDGGWITTREGIKKHNDRWQKQFKAVKVKGRKGKTRDTMHFTFSAGADQTPENREKVLAAAQAVAKKHFKGHEYVIGLHQDAKHPHVHVLLNTHPKLREKGKTQKFHYTNSVREESRKDFGRELSMRGLEHIATRKSQEKPPHLHEQIGKQLASLERRERQFQRGMKRKAPRRDVPGHREAVRKQLGRMQTAIDKASWGTMQKGEAQKAVRNFSKDFERRHKKLNVHELNSTMRSIEGNVKGLENDSEDARGMKGSNKRQRGKTIENLGKTGLGQIERARKAIRESKQLPKEQRLDALKLLKGHERSIHKAMGRSKGR
ncbi:relaxase/mobilization nuclease domain-containing protein [Desulfovibrio ferrophilus]|uniref:MobA/VirD2-like nuclease domain-containing protein n=1 Tax=Desulfovibrio ferrophilus TaxID=241368 RepID=A0A2Z6B440_9BACT|nr:relaxase/mobilization nuclease domain-containing protein [Desulfovibrio ferrophilus]BBD10145.1 putative uncharacterized protein [Desulfovibrio ferrophilus]